MKFTTRPMSLDDRLAYLMDHPSPEDKAACNEAIADATHELNKIKQRIKVTVADLLKTEYAKARAESRKPSVDIGAILMTAWEKVLADRETATL